MTTFASYWFSSSKADGFEFCVNKNLSIKFMQLTINVTTQMKLRVRVGLHFDGVPLEVLR